MADRSISLLQSNIKILEQDCGVAQLVVDAAASRAGNLYLGLDISTQSTGYAVLGPSTISPGSSSSSPEGLLRGVGDTKLVEWGFIVGSGSGSKKKDVVDVGVIVAGTLMELAERCRHEHGNRAAAQEELIGDDGDDEWEISWPWLGWSSRRVRRIAETFAGCRSTYVDYLFPLCAETRQQLLVLG